MKPRLGVFQTVNPGIVSHEQGTEETLDCSLMVMVGDDLDII